MTNKPAFKIEGEITGTYQAMGSDFITTAVEHLEMDFEGLVGDFHRGFTRKSGGREPWYPRGTEMRNERQISLLSQEELQDVAMAMGLDEIKPEWIGANLLIAGIPNLTQLPPRTCLFFEGGVTLRIDGDNAPCRVAGKAIAEATGNGDAELSFPKHAKDKRGLVAWVEKSGVIKEGEKFTAKIPPQRLY
jgi:hypothetical protein